MCEKKSSGNERLSSSETELLTLIVRHDWTVLQAEGNTRISWSARVSRHKMDGCVGIPDRKLLQNSIGVSCELKRFAFAREVAVWRRLFPEGQERLSARTLVSDGSGKNTRLAFRSLSAQILMSTYTTYSYTSLPLTCGDITYT